MSLSWTVGGSGDEKLRRRRCRIALLFIKWRCSPGGWHKERVVGDWVWEGERLRADAVGDPECVRGGKK